MVIWYINCRPICLPDYLYLLKAIFLFQRDSSVPKLKKIEGGKTTHPFHKTWRIIFRVSENLFFKTSWFFCFSSKDFTEWSKRLWKTMVWTFLKILYKKCTKYWSVIYWPVKEIHISKTPLIGFFWFLA